MTVLQLVVMIAVALFLSWVAEAQTGNNPSKPIPVWLRRVIIAVCITLVVVITLWLLVLCGISVRAFA